MLILLIFFQLFCFSEGNWGTPYASYWNAMTPSGFPIYGMAPYASSSVAYSGFSPVYSYGTGGSTYSIVGSGYSNPGAAYSNPGAAYSNPGAAYSTLGSGSSIDFDSIPIGNIQPGSVIGQPVAVRYFNQPIPVNIDPSALRPLGKKFREIIVKSRVQFPYEMTLTSVSRPVTTCFLISKHDFATTFQVPLL